MASKIESGVNKGAKRRSPWGRGSKKCDERGSAFVKSEERRHKKVK